MPINHNKIIYNALIDWKVTAPEKILYYALKNLPNEIKKKSPYDNLIKLFDATIDTIQQPSSHVRRAIRCTDSTCNCSKEREKLQHRDLERGKTVITKVITFLNTLDVEIIRKDEELKKLFSAFFSYFPEYFVHLSEHIQKELHRDLNWPTHYYREYINSVINHIQKKSWDYNVEEFSPTIILYFADDKQLDNFITTLYQEVLSVITTRKIEIPNNIDLRTEIINQLENELSINIECIINLVIKSISRNHSDEKAHTTIIQPSNPKDENLKKLLNLAHAYNTANAAEKEKIVNDFKNVLMHFTDNYASVYWFNSYPFTILYPQLSEASKQEFRQLMLSKIIPINDVNFSWLFRKLIRIDPNFLIDAAIKHMSIYAAKNFADLMTGQFYQAIVDFSYDSFDSLSKETQQALATFIIEHKLYAEHFFTLAGKLAAFYSPEQKNEIVKYYFKCFDDGYPLNKRLSPIFSHIASFSDYNTLIRYIREVIAMDLTTHTKRIFLYPLDGGTSKQIIDAHKQVSERLKVEALASAAQIDPEFFRRQPPMKVLSKFFPETPTVYEAMNDGVTPSHPKRRRNK